jgi:hypothetical protein
MVMTKQELLVLVDELKVLQSDLGRELNEINNDKKSQYLKVINDVFESVPNTTIDNSSFAGDSFRFYMDNNGRKDGYFTLYVSENYDTEVFNELETSFYTTTTSSDYELERMINLGIIGKLIRDNKKDIIQKLNTIRENFKNSTRGLDKKRYEISNDLTELRYKIEEMERVEMLEKAKSEGITFERPRSLQVKVDHKIWSCLGFKILSMTPTGKSATIEATYKAFDEVNSYVVKNVRMNYLNEYLR